MAFTFSSQQQQYPTGMQRMVDEFARQLYDTGLIRQVTVERNIGTLVQDFTVRLTDSRCMRWAITDEALAMGGAEALRYWFERIENDIRLASGADANTIYMRQDIWPAPLFDLHRHSEEADSRASELFKLMVGTEAFAILDAGKPLPIMGSQGTAYTLHKRASYCVERVKDGAKLCAVVPGVPLWDHLLGIKLMVENDEPRFLKTANVSAGSYGGLTLTQAFIDEYAQIVDAGYRASNPIGFR